MKTKIKLKGERANLDNITLFEIWKTLQKADSSRVKISINGIQGEIIKGINTSSFDIIKAIKRKTQKHKTLKKAKTSGELQVISDLTNTMQDLYTARTNQMMDRIDNILKTTIEKGSKYPQEWFKPPQGVAEEARRGLELRRKYKRGGLDTREASKEGIGSGVQRAVNLKNRDTVSPDTIKRMRSFFARHEKNKNSMTDKGEPGAGKIAWLLWGGDSGRSWANKVYKKMERYDKIKSDKKGA